MMFKGNGILSSKYFRLSALVITFGTIYFIAYNSGLKQMITVEFVQDLFKTYPVLSFFIICNLFALTNAMQIPGWAILIAAVLTLGRFWGGVVTYFAAIYGCALVFLFVRYIGKSTVDSFHVGWMEKLFDSLDEKPFRNMILLRLIGQTSPILNYSLALSKVSFKNYMLGTIVAMPIPITINCIFFDFFVNLFKSAINQ